MGSFLLLAIVFMLGGLVVVIAGVAASRSGQTPSGAVPDGAPTDVAEDGAGGSRRALIHHGSARPEGTAPAIRISTRAGVEECPVDAEPFTIGRRCDNQLVLAHDSVSRQHAQIQRESGRWHIVDSGSANGVYVNGRR